MCTERAHLSAKVEELAVDQAKTGFMPPYSVWIGNLALTGIGAWIMRSVIRH